ncbi:MAG: hypothetical protein KC442_05605 [Thermomicrobiales bacterium]|nr:hypothetical protein [Thermomicrobiales bacterium]
MAHADWSIHSRKRWLACAQLRGGVYTASAPENVVDAGSLLQRLRGEAPPGGPVVVGFDFPIGLPAAYARRAGITDYLAWLPMMGTGEWTRFHEVASRPEELSLHRPFYPNTPGGTKLRFLLDALDLPTIDDLRRVCERRHTLARAASPLFWTMGANQVGKAALSGWRDMLMPALRTSAGHIAIWPFAGNLSALLTDARVVVVETYPGEMYHHLGVTWPHLGPGIPSGKRSQPARRRNAQALLAWAMTREVSLAPALVAAISDGFGAGPDGEDRFDAVVGLFGMLNVLLGHRALHEPADAITQRVEGWIFGRAAG